MDILYLLIPVSIVLVFLVGAAFFWSLRSGQYEDLEGPAHRMLMDDDRPTSVRVPGERGDRPLPEATASDKGSLH